MKKRQPPVETCHECGQPFRQGDRTVTLRFEEGERKGEEVVLHASCLAQYYTTTSQPVVH